MHPYLRFKFPQFLCNFLPQFECDWQHTQFTCLIPHASIRATPSPSPSYHTSPHYYNLHSSQSFYFLLLSPLYLLSTFVCPFAKTCEAHPPYFLFISLFYLCKYSPPLGAILGSRGTLWQVDSVFFSFLFLFCCQQTSHVKATYFPMQMGECDTPPPLGGIFIYLILCISHICPIRQLMQTHAPAHTHTHNKKTIHSCFFSVEKRGRQRGAQRSKREPVPQVVNRETFTLNVTCICLPSFFPPPSAVLTTRPQSCSFSCGRLCFMS